MKRPTPVFRLLGAIGFVVLLAIPVRAQDSATPDISGTWALNPAKSKVSKKVTLDPETLVVKCAGASIEIATSSNGKQSLEMYVADGKEYVKNIGLGGQTYTRAQCKKSVLITESGSRLTGTAMGTFPVITNKERWSISADGHTLFLKTSSDDTPDQLFVYDKK